VPTIELTAEEVVSEFEIAERAQVDLERVRTWRLSSDVPAPVTTLTIGSPWNWTEVVEWIGSASRK
jgi:hypothetical protein